MNGAPALRQMTGILDRLGVEWFVGGSLASAQFGEPRSTANTDFGAVIPQSCIAPLVQAAGAEFYVSEPAVRDAVARGRSFNLIHLATTWKFDVFAVRPGTPGEVALRRRRRIEVDLGDVGLSLWMATAEDVVLMKLGWFRRGGGVSDRQWNDLVGFLPQLIVPVTGPRDAVTAVPIRGEHRFGGFSSASPPFLASNASGSNRSIHPIDLSFCSCSGAAAVNSAIQRFRSH